MPKFVEIDKATGKVQGFIENDRIDATALPDMGTRTLIPVVDFPPEVSRWNGTAFVSSRPARLVVSGSRCVELFLEAEIGLLLAAVDAGNAKARYAWERIKLGVDLADPKVTALLVAMKARGVFGADAAAADARIAAIVANQDPV